MMELGSAAIEAVLAAMRQAAEQAILPRFRALQAGDVEEKSPGEVVTRADREAEAIIGAALGAIRPDALVVGEEASAANPELLKAVGTGVPVWLVDPLDGTANFVAGQEDFAVMVALVQQDQTTHAWIWQPLTGESWIAVRGAGTELNGARVGLSAGSRLPGSLRGAVLTRFLTPEHRQAIDLAAPSLGEILPGRLCAGVEYPAIVTGGQDFALFRRTLPWDHAPGALILREAGGVARRWTGEEYQPGDGLEGLLAARDPDTWSQAAQAMLPPPSATP